MARKNRTHRILRPIRVDKRHARRGAGKFAAHGFMALCAHVVVNAVCDLLHIVLR